MEGILKSNWSCPRELIFLFFFTAEMPFQNLLVVLSNKDNNDLIKKCYVLFFTLVTDTLQKNKDAVKGGVVSEGKKKKNMH